MKPIIETERLVLRKMEEEDAPDFFLLNSDPDVMRYTGDKPFANVEEARQLVINYQPYKKHGYGRWTMLHRHTGEFIGWCGLKYNEDIQEVDLGYRLLKKFWNMGYATEAAAACIQYGFEHLQLNRIIGRAEKENTASVRVLQKLGLLYEKEYLEDGIPLVQYYILK